MSDPKVTMVLVDLTNIPRGGSASMLTRLSPEYKDVVDLAAQALGLTQADFLRSAIVNTSLKVLSENARPNKE